MANGNRRTYTLEFKIEAVRLVRAGQSVPTVAATLGVRQQSTRNWVKADAQGLLNSGGRKYVRSGAASSSAFVTGASLSTLIGTKPRGRLPVD